MDKLDETLQRKLKLQSLMEAAGLVVFKEDIDDDMAYAESQINDSKKGFISESGLNRLNYNLGIKAGLQMALNRLANYEDELVGDNVKSQK